VAFLPLKRKAFAMSLTKVVGSRIEPVLAALLFAVSYMVGIFALTTPQFDEPDTVWEAFWADRSHRITEIVAAYALLVSGAALVWFATVLGRRVGSRLLVPSAWAAAVMLWVGGVLLSAVPAAVSISRAPAFSAETARITIDMGAAAVAMYAAPATAFVLAAAAVAARRTHALPGWLVWSAWVVAVVVVLLGDAFFVLPLVPLWAIASGAVLSARRPAVTDVLTRQAAALA
jgi:hypothetical protein